MWDLQGQGILLKLPVGSSYIQHLSVVMNLPCFSLVTDSVNETCLYHIDPKIIDFWQAVMCNKNLSTASLWCAVENRGNRTHLQITLPCPLHHSFQPFGQFFCIVRRAIRNYSSHVPMPMRVNNHTWSILIYNKHETSPCGYNNTTAGLQGRRCTQRLKYFRQLIHTVHSKHIKTLCYWLHKAFCPSHINSIFHRNIYSLSFKQFVMDFVTLFYSFVQCTLPLHRKATVHWWWQIVTKV